MYNKKLVFIAACIGLFINGFSMLSLGTLNIYLKTNLGIDNITISLFASFMAVGTLTGSMTFGPIVDRFSYRILLTSSAIVLLVGFIGIAFTDKVIPLQVFFLFLGFGSGLLNGSTTALVADISPNDKSANISLLHSFYGFGAMGMPLFTAILLGFFPYKIILIIIGGMMIIPAIYFFILKFPAPKQPKGIPFKKIKSLIKDGALLSLSFILLFQGANESLMNNWSTDFLKFKITAKIEQILFVFSMYSIGFTIFRLILFKILKVFSTIDIFNTGLLASILGIVILYLSSSLFLSSLGILLLGIGFASLFPIILGYIADIYYNYSGTALSISFCFSLIGSIIFNILTGIISSNFGIDRLLIILILNVSIIYFIFNKSKKSIKKITAIMK